MKWCVTCNSYQKAWSEVCKSHCGNDCENRCYNCNRLFSGELVAGQNQQLARNNAQAAAAAASALAAHADKSGGRVNVRVGAYETNIEYIPPKR